MARLARNRHWATRTLANRLHHVTNRGVDRGLLFTSPLDRIVFLSMLAAFCLDDGLRIHSFCLMSNHFHLLAEDPRGMLSHMMLRLQTAYARYFRDSKNRRGSGHVFGDRFFNRMVVSERYYRRVVGYILRNPLECDEPLAPSAETYLWSSAGIHVAEITSAAGCRALVDRFGGIDALLASLPRAATKKVELARRHRMESLVGGEWLDADSARDGRTGAELSHALTERVTLPWVDDDAVVEEAPAPTVLAEYRGHARTVVLEALQTLTGTDRARDDVTTYTLWRFAKGNVARLAKFVGTTADKLMRAISRVRGVRLSNAAAHEALSRLEWRLTFALGGAPWRL